MANDERTTLLEFPCQFPIKAMGKAHPDLSQVIIDIIGQHAPDVTQADIQFRYSKDKHYISLTVMITATSQTQLDAIYRDLTANELILVAL